jgi:hypothetical protein
VSADPEKERRVWDWVPGYVDSPPTSLAYVLCKRCQRKIPKVPNSIESQRRSR